MTCLEKEVANESLIVVLEPVGTEINCGDIVAVPIIDVDLVAEGILLLPSSSFIP